MSDRVGMSLGSLAAAAVPFLCALVGVIASNLPISLFGGSLPAPLFALMPLYFWSLVRPDLVPPWIVFTVGLFEDLLSGSPPGIWTASFVASYAFVDRQRESFAGLAGIGTVLGFGLAALIAMVTAYVIFWAYYGRIPPATPLVLQLMTSVLFYVPAAAVMNWIQRHLVGPMRSEF